ncbi:MAG TPA: hypothetical protein VK358_18380, partial [Longimicrobium sp.]|nr:hypothetical protein [Longimicrobium sp.]
RDFRAAIENGVGSCDVMVAVMGSRWADSGKPAGETDFVHLEIATALRRDIPVIPVLVQGAAPPHPSRLPPELEALAWRNAFELRHTRWDVDVNELKRAIEQIVPAAATPATHGTARGGTRSARSDGPPQPRRVLGLPARTAAVLGAAAVMAGAGYLVARSGPGGAESVVPPVPLARADSQAIVAQGDSTVPKNDVPPEPAEPPAAGEHSGRTPERPEGAGPAFTGQPPLHLGWDSRRMSPAQASLKAVESMRDRENFIHAEANGNDAWGYDERSFVMVHSAPVDDGAFIFVVSFSTDADEAGRLRNSIREDVFDDRRLSLQAPRVHQSPRARVQGPLAARWVVFDKGGLPDFAACAQGAIAANGLQVTPNDNHTVFGTSATASMVALAVSHAGNTEVLVLVASGDAAEAERIRNGVRASIAAC